MSRPDAFSLCHLRRVGPSIRAHAGAWARMEIWGRERSLAQRSGSLGSMPHLSARAGIKGKQGQQALPAAPPPQFQRKGGER